MWEVLLTAKWGEEVIAEAEGQDTREAEGTEEAMATEE